MTNKRQPVRSITHEFTEFDVQKCKSLDKLRNWMRCVQFDIESMERKIENNKHRTDNKEWMSKIKTALLIQKRLVQIIEDRIIELKDDPPQFCQLEMKMIEVAEQELDRETFERIKELAKKKIMFDSL